MNFSSLNYIDESSEPFGSMNNIGDIISSTINNKNNLIEEPLKIHEHLLNSLNYKENLEINDPEFKYEEIDNIILKLKEFSKTFDGLQENLEKSHEKCEILEKKTADNIKKINSSIQFIRASNSEYENDTQVKLIIDALIDYTKSIAQNDKLKEAKQEYIKQRKQLNKHIYLINSINNWNISSICPICVTDKIDSYCNPCGHTACRGCLDKTSNINNNINHNKCPICREHVMDIRKLYFI